MEICSSRHVWAPNVWTTTEVLDATVRCDHHGASAALADVVERIDAALPGRQALFGPFSTAQEPDNGDGDMRWPRLLAEVALALQSHARPPDARFLRVLGTAEPQQFRVVIEARDRLLAADCLRHAVTILNDACAGQPLDLREMLTELVDYADDVCLGPSTMLIVRAAEARGIPWLRMSEWSLVQLGQGGRHRRIWTAESDLTPAIAEAISRDKQLTKQLLEAAGVPVPRGRVVTTAAEAWEAAQSVGTPVVMKPLDGNHGRGVFLNLSTRDEIEQAFPVALDGGRRGIAVIVEQFVPGVEHRLLVIGSKLVACAKGEHLFVTGDGQRTVAELIDLQINCDARRGRSETMPNKTVDIDATVLTQLAQEGVAPETVPVAGRRVLVKQIGSHGPDVKADVHPEIAAAAVRAARTVGLDIAGIDLVAVDISRPFAEQGAKVCEVNAGPQLLIHAHPPSGPGQPIGEAIVAELFRPGETGRIPLVACVGQPATTAAILLERMLLAAGRTPGLTCAAGKWVGGWRCSAESLATPAAARDLLMSPEIESAVFELDWRAAARQGLPTDCWQTLVLLPPAQEEVSSAPTPEPDGLLAVVETMIKAVDAQGTVVVVASESELSARAHRSGRQVITVAASDDAPAQPSAAGHHIAVRVGQIVHEHNGVSEPILPLAEVTKAGQVEPQAVLAAVAAAIGMGVLPSAIRTGLTSI